MFQGRRKLLRDSLPRVDEMGFERHPGKTLTIIGGVAMRLLLSIENLIKRSRFHREKTGIIKDVILEKIIESLI